MFGPPGPLPQSVRRSLPTYNCMTTFSELSISPALLANLVRQNITTPTQVQALSVPPGLAGKDIVATAQTGTGKTLAFLLPMLESLLKAEKKPGVQALVLSPTRELAIQIQKAFVELARGTGFRAATVVGGLNENGQLNDIRQGAQVIIATPGRLCDFLDRNLVKLNTVRLLVLDEGDRMLDMGFLPSIERILSGMSPDRQTLFFSATIEKSAERLIQKYLRQPLRIEAGAHTHPADKVDLHVYEIDQERKLPLLQYMLEHEAGSFLVFARTKHGVDKLQKNLGRVGVKAARIHGDRTQGQRNQALDGFKKGTYRVLVATDVAARGIHVEGIAHVINFDLPMASEDFVHRVGRTGRAGARGVASTFGTSADRQTIRRFERELKMSLTRRPTTEAMAWHKDHVPAAALFEDPAPSFAPKPAYGKSQNRTEPAWAKSGAGATKPRTFGGGFKPKTGASKFGGPNKFGGTARRATTSR